MAATGPWPESPPDPERLERNRHKLDQIASETEIDPRLAATAFGCGSFLERQANRTPWLVSPLAQQLIEGGPRALLDWLPRDVPIDNPLQDLRGRRNQSQALVALAQATGQWTPQQVWEAISDVASTVVDQAYYVARHNIARQFGELLDSVGSPANLTVLGFGKLGVRELNFSSDVDLVLVSPDLKTLSAGGDRPAIDAGQWFERLARRFVALLQEVTANGFAYRVDLRLRPDGTRGRLVPGRQAFLEYYPNYSSTWERLALLRARAVAGDVALGQQILEELERFIFPRHLDFDALDSMRIIKDKIDREAKRHENAVDFKFGPGGIRELEFLVQNLQIIYGGQQPSIRPRGTLQAITALTDAGLLDPAHGAELKSAYTRLRQIENTVQAMDDRQTYVLPEGPEADVVARACGYMGDTPGQSLHSDLGALMNNVAGFFDDLYAGPADQSRDVRIEVFELLENADLDHAGQLDLIRRLGFVDPEAARRLLLRLIAGPSENVYGARTREKFNQLLPAILHEISTCQNPDQALEMTSELVFRIGGRAYFYALIRENPRLIRAIVRLFAGSLYLARFFMRNPGLLDSLVLRDYAVTRKTARQFRRAARTALTNAQNDLEAEMDALRDLRNQEVLRVGLHDLNGAIWLPNVQRQLSTLARTMITEVRDLAFRNLGTGWQVPVGSQRDLIPIALGKLGSGEMNYGSDLDLIFVLAPDATINLELAIRAAQKMITIIQAKTTAGSLYEVDMRLRPSGNQGLLVTTFDAFCNYHETNASIWERVALVKNRVIETTPAAGQIRRQIRSICFDQPLTADDIDEMIRVRDRMVAERGQAEPFKTGVGGTADIEFAVALTQLRHARQVRGLSSPNPQQALGAFRRLPHPYPEFGDVLLRALYSYRLLETRLHLLLDRPSSKIPERPELQTSLAASLGFSGFNHMDEYFTQTATQVRAVFLQCLERLAAEQV